MTERVLVTGGAGFVGSHLVDRLLKSGYEVVVLDDLSGGFDENVHSEAIFRQRSILETSLVNHLFAKYRFTYVYHLGAYAAEGLSHFIKNFNYQNNLVGSVNLINAAVNYGTKCFVFTSSMAVYGSQEPPFTEEMPTAPEDSYGIAKAAVEQELKITKELFGLDYVIFRPHNCIGERQNLRDPYRNVAAIFMNQILHGKPMTIFGDGEQQRAFSYVGDIIPAIADSPKNPAALGQTFNIGGEVPCTINELSVMIAGAMGLPMDPYSIEMHTTHLPPRHEVKNAFCSHDKAHRVFGAQVQTPLPFALQKMAEWAKTKGPQDGKPFEGIEIEKNLPESWRR